MTARHERAAAPPRQLARDALAGNTAARSLAALGFAGLWDLAARSADAHRPVPVHAVDPRDGLPVVYSETRSRRMTQDGCVVCDNQTCPAVDWTELGDGDLAYLTPNLYPIVFPFEGAAGDGRDGPVAAPARAAAPAGAGGHAHARTAHAPPPGADARATIRGVHLVQWSSLRHDGGLVGAGPEVAAAILRQAARAEEFLLHGAGAAFPATGDGHRGHVAFIKNRGRRVGASVEHDHQQIMLGSVPPREPRLASGLAPRLLAEARAELLVDAIDGLATTLVAPFMRRPLHAFIVPAGPEVGHLHHLEPAVLDALALAIARLTAAVTTLMEPGGAEVAWNLVVHTGQGCGPLVELRPATQPLGGYEHLGLYLCEERPETSAARLREVLAAPR